MKNRTITQVIILGAIAIIGILGVQSYWVVNTWNINEEEFNKKVNLALRNVAEFLAETNGSKLPPRNIVNQRTTNYYIVNIEDEIDANLLELALREEFEARALNIDFEYAVFDCTTDEMVYGNYISYSPDTRSGGVQRGHLPRYDEFTYYFGVKFPTRSGYLFGKMQLSIYFSLILVLILFFFAYSMYVILRQKQLSELQKDFINNMTHEFKTPLSTIKISADVFLHDPIVRADRRLWQYARIIREQNQRLNKQVEKVLQLAKIEKGNFEIKREYVELQPILEGIADSIRPRLENKSGHISTDLAAARVTLFADPLHLANILHNLLDNAVKYCRQTPYIQLLSERRGNLLYLFIKDNGIGIDREYQHRVFDKFFRIPTGNVHNVKGFGLGLYYVKKICDAHGWKIKMESSPGKGTVFLIVMDIESTRKPPS